MSNWVLFTVVKRTWEYNNIIVDCIPKSYLKNNDSSIKNIYVQR